VRILVVDDSEDSRDLTEGMLLSAGYNDLLIATSGVDTLRLLENFRTSSGRPAIDLVLLDVVMPKMNGIEVCAQIRKDSGCADLPIIMVTSLDDMNSLVGALKAGANDYLTKPINRADLIARLRGMFRDTALPSSSPYHSPRHLRAWVLAGLWLIATATLVYIF
jgi:phosphoserine phosphatase RsbU/P